MKRDNIGVTVLLTFIVDIFSMVASFLIAGYSRGGILEGGLPRGIYGNLFIVIFLSVIVIGHGDEHNKNIFKRGYFEELVSLIKDQGKLALIVFGYMFIFQLGGFYSRVFLFLFFALYSLMTYVLRTCMKIILLLGYKTSQSSNKVMLITVSRNALRTMRKMRGEYEWSIQVNSIAIWDEDRVGDTIEGIKVVANRDNLFEMAKLIVVDEVFINIPRSDMQQLEELVLEFEKMGVTVHINLDLFDNLIVKEKTVNEYAGHQVITFSSVLFDARNAIVKRLIDILGGLVGTILTLILTLILAPIILIESKGPVFFSQVRVGKNGRKFKIYKFRSMCKDAEQRKKALEDQNEVNGLMFKMTNDPRVTKVGKFIRKTSLDEFPQFFNVLIGDMSLVGTRPPTEDEFIQYEGRHKKRLSLKPGLTGLWQVSGRSNVNEFEEVIKMDIEYIDQWSMLLDVKLILKTIMVMFTGRGSR